MIIISEWHYRVRLETFIAVQIIFFPPLTLEISRSMGERLELVILPNTRNSWVICACSAPARDEQRRESLGKTQLFPRSLRTLQGSLSCEFRRSHTRLGHPTRNVQRLVFCDSLGEGPCLLTVAALGPSPLV